MRVVVADDHQAYRLGLGRLLRAHGIEVVAEVSNGSAAVRAAERDAPDVVIMDLSMPGTSGLEATRLLAEMVPQTRVVVLSVSAQEGDIDAALGAGAAGYVLKDRPVDDVIAAIRAAVAGHTPIAPPAAPAR